MTSIPEYCITVHAPATTIRRYLKYYLFFVLHNRGVEVEGGYEYEDFEGEPLCVPVNPSVREYFDDYIQRAQNFIQDKAQYTLSIYISKVNDKEFVERWVFVFQTDFDVTQNPLPTQDALTVAIKEKMRTAPSMAVRCTFLGALKKDPEDDHPDGNEDPNRTGTR